VSDHLSQKVADKNGLFAESEKLNTWLSPEARSSVALRRVAQPVDKIQFHARPSSLQRHPSRPEPALPGWLPAQQDLVESSAAIPISSGENPVW